MGRSIYLAIMDAFERGAGLRLTANEVHELAQDSAIVTRAAVCLDDDNDFLLDGFTWRRAYRLSREAGHGG